VIYEPDLIARRRYIRNLLGDIEGINGNNNAQRRVRRHDQLIAHMEIAYSSARKMWYQSPLIQKEGRSLKKSLETKERRDEFVRNTLEAEWAAMSTKIGREEDELKKSCTKQKPLQEIIGEDRAAMHTQGTSQESAIELD
jgi:hypothetical protein